jgi:hypothetical protein
MAPTASPSKPLTIPQKPIDSARVMEREMARLNDEKRRRSENSVNDKFFNNIFNEIMQRKDHNSTIDPRHIQEIFGEYGQKIQGKKAHISNKINEISKMPEETLNKKEVLSALRHNLEFVHKVEQKLKTIMPALIGESSQDIFPTPLIIFKDLSEQAKQEYKQGVRIVDMPKGFRIPETVEMATFQEDSLKTLLIQRILKGRVGCQNRPTCAAMDQKVIAQYEQNLQRSLDALDQQSNALAQRGRRGEKTVSQKINTDAITSMIENLGMYLNSIPNQQAAQRISQSAVASVFLQIFKSQEHEQKLKDMTAIQQAWADFVGLRSQGKTKLPWVDERKSTQEKEKKEAPTKSIIKKAKDHVGTFKENLVEGAKQKADDAVKTALSNLGQNILNGGSGNILGGLFG